MTTNPQRRHRQTDRRTTCSCTVAARGSVTPPGQTFVLAAPPCSRSQPTTECGKLPSVRVWGVAPASGVPRRLEGLEPLPLACDLRNKRVRMRQNMVFSTKKYEKFSGEGTHPSPSADPPLSAPAAPSPLPFKNPGYATAPAEDEILCITPLVDGYREL